MQQDGSDARSERAEKRVDIHAEGGGGGGDSMEEAVDCEMTMHGIDIAAARESGHEIFNAISNVICGDDCAVTVSSACNLFCLLGCTLG